MTRLAIVVGGAVSLLALAPTVLSPSHLYSLTDVLVLALFATSFNLLFGHLGLLSFGHAAYFGVGAYTSALLLARTDHTSLFAALLSGTLAGALAGAVIGYFCVRLSGPYFAMLTLAFGQLLFAVAWKWRDLTRGDDGFGGFVGRVWLPFAASEAAADLRAQYYLVVAVAVPILLAVWALMTRTPFGAVVSSLRQNDERAAFLGYDVFAAKLVTYVIAAGLAGLAGCLSAIFHDFVSPSAIDLALSTDVVLMAFVGGTGAFFGPALGAAFFVYFGDFISRLTERWQIIMGLIFILMVLYAPQGFAGATALLPRPRRPSLPPEGPK